MGLQRVGHDWATELRDKDLNIRLKELITTSIGSDFQEEWQIDEANSWEIKEALPIVLNDTKHHLSLMIYPRWSCLHHWKVSNILVMTRHKNSLLGSELRFQNNKESPNGKFINLHCVELWTPDAMNSIWFLLDQWSPAFWRQEPISGKTMFPQTRVRKMVSG